MPGERIIPVVGASKEVDDAPGDDEEAKRRAIVRLKWKSAFVKQKLQKKLKKVRDEAAEGASDSRKAIADQKSAGK